MTITKPVRAATMHDWTVACMAAQMALCIGTHGAQVRRGEKPARFQRFEHLHQRAWNATLAPG